MTSLAPPRQQARTERSVVRSMPPHHVPVAAAAGARRYRSVTVANPAAAGVGKTTAWALETASRAVVVWKITGVPAAPLFIPVDDGGGGSEGEGDGGKSDMVEFVAEGFAPHTIVTCTTRGVVRFRAEDGGSAAGIAAGLTLVPPDAEGVVVTLFTTDPAEKRVIAALSHGGLVIATLGGSSDRFWDVAAMNLSAEWAAGDSSRAAPRRTRKSAGGSWFTSWLGLGTAAAALVDWNEHDLAQALGAALLPNSVAAPVEIRAVVTSRTRADELYCATSDNAVACLHLSRDVLTLRWRVQITDAALKCGVITSLCANEAAVGGACVAYSGDCDGSSTGASGIIIGLHADTGERTMRVPFATHDYRSPRRERAGQSSGAANHSMSSVLGSGSICLISTGENGEMAHVATHRAVLRVPLQSTTRGGFTAETIQFSSEIVAAGVSECGTIVALTHSGPQMVPHAARGTLAVAPPMSTTGVRAARSAPSPPEVMSSSALMASILASTNERMSIDLACISACEDIVRDTGANPANWARGDLDAEDINLLTFVTAGLISRQERHRAVVECVLADRDISRRLQAATVAEMISQQERLTAMVAIRKLQNIGLGGVHLDRDVGRLLKAAIVEVVAHARASRHTNGSRVDTENGPSGDAAATVDGSFIDEEQNLSSAEKFFKDDSALVPLLVALNRHHETIEPMPRPLNEKLSEGLAVSTIAAVVCEAVDASRRELEPPSDALPHMWTALTSDASATFEAAMIQQMWLCADTLALSVDVRRARRQDLAGETAPLSAAVDSTLDALEVDLLSRLRIITEFLFRHHSHRSLGAFSAVLRRSLFRGPFFAVPLGYPAGDPAPAESFAICHEVAKCVEQTALTFSIFDVLCDLALSTRVEDPLRSPASYETFRRYCEQCPGLFGFALGWLAEAQREREVELLHLLVPGVADGKAQRDQFLASRAPHLHWVVDPLAYQSLHRASRSAEYPLLPEEDARTNRHATLALAKLSWAAAGRPQARKFAIDQDLLIVKAQKEYLPGAAKTYMSANEAAGALLGVYVRNPADRDAQRALLLATQIADKIADEGVQMPLLAEIFSRACELDDVAPRIQHIRGGADGDVEMMARIGSLLPSRVIETSGVLKKGVFSPGGGVVRRVLEDQAEVFAMLASWAKSRFLH